jgi:hypothetical protein
MAAQACGCAAALRISRAWHEPMFSVRISTCCGSVVYMRAGELGVVQHRADVTSKRNRWLPRRDGTSSSRSPRALGLPRLVSWSAFQPRDHLDARRAGGRIRAARWRRAGAGVSGLERHDRPRDVGARHCARRGAGAHRRAQSSLNAFTDVTAARARTQAEALDARRAAGETLGPLAGVPFAVGSIRVPSSLANARPTGCASRWLAVTPYRRTGVPAEAAVARRRQRAEERRTLCRPLGRHSSFRPCSVGEISKPRTRIRCRRSQPGHRGAHWGSCQGRSPQCPALGGSCRLNQ